MAGIALALGSAVAHTGWNTLSKAGASGGAVFVWLCTAIAAVIVVPVAVVITLMQSLVPEWSWLGAGLVGAILHGAYSLVLQAGYRRAEVSVVYPVSRGLAPVLVSVLGAVVLGQLLAGLAWVGVGLIAVSVLLLMRNGPAEGSRQGGGSGAVGWGALTAVAICAYTLWDAAVVVEMRIPPVSYYAVVAALQLVMVSVVVRNRIPDALRSDRRRLRMAAMVGVLVPLSYVLGLYALDHAPVATVAAVRSTSIIMSSFVAWLWLRERLSARRIGSALLATVAVVLLGLPSV